MTEQPSGKRSARAQIKDGYGRGSRGKRPEAAGRVGEGNRPASAIDRNDTAEVAAIPVIGIGASAGGIEALSQYFDAMQADCGCAFVVVLHLDPKRESELARILSVHTTMPVLQVEEGMRLAAALAGEDNRLWGADGWEPT